MVEEREIQILVSNFVFELQYEILRELQQGSQEMAFRACIVGTGPSGMYTAKYLLKEWPVGSRIDLIERLPTPYGLVRFGVAPDHQEVKSVQNDFAHVLSDSRIRYFGNVTVGKDVSIEDLQLRYHAVVLATGADHDRELGLKNEKKFVSGARDFVAWYNGHPDVSYESSTHFSKLIETSERCVIIGNGNVAIDCARILLSSIDKLRWTDISDRALDVFSRSKIKHVSIIGRRGHPQASFTMKELREITKLDQVKFQVFESELDLGGKTEASKGEIETHRPVKRMDALLRETLKLKAKDGPFAKSLTLRFLLSPSEILLDSKDQLFNLRCERMELTGPTGAQQAKGTGIFEDFPCEMILRSVGYKAFPIQANLPFDDKRGIIQTKDGGKVVDGLYAVGWIKRGPTGIIGTNIPDAKETVDSIIRDTEILKQKSIYNEDLEVLLNSKCLKFVDWPGYLKIEQEEERRGEASNPKRPRVKFQSRDEMLEVAFQSSS